MPDRRSARRISTPLLVALLMWGGCGSAPSMHQASLDAFASHLDARVPALLDTYDVPGAALALIAGGEVVWTGAYGYADRDRGRRMTTKAVFRAESISKSLTAWGVMRLAEHGLVDLDAPVERFLGGWALPDAGPGAQAVTARRLLSHDAGMPLGTIGEEYAPESELPALRDYLAREARPDRPPGSGFAYSNAGFNLLELLVEETTGQRFADFMDAEVLGPLGMASSAFGWSARLGARMPTGYELDGEPVAPYVYPSQTSGGLLATAGDLGRFVAAAVPGRADSVLSAASVRALHTPRVDVGGAYGVVADAYGLGHFVEALPDGRRAVWHGGQGHGWMSHVHAVPDSGDGLVLLTNSERSWPLMAHVLADWADWAGLGSVQMERITVATTVLRVLIALLVLGALGQAVRLVRGLLAGRRRWAPWSEGARVRRGLQALLGVGLLAALGWAAAQPYLMLASVFPREIGALGAALALVALTLLLSALLVPPAPRFGSAFTLPTTP